MSKITQSAKGEPCSLRIPSVCNRNNETTVFCHAPSVDKGMGIKSPDFWGAYGCFNCHEFMDQSIWKRSDAQGLAAMYWNKAIFETLKKLIDKELVVIP